MAKPKNEFGGWLRFFQVTNILGVIIMVVVSIVLVLALIVTITESNYKETIEFIIFFTDITIGTVLIIKILKIIKKQEEVIPARIRYYLLLVLLFTGAFLIVEIPVAYWANGGALISEDYDSFKGSVQTIIYCVIWRSYFIKSERVRLYYSKAPLSPER